MPTSTATELLPVIRREDLVWVDGGDGRSLIVGMTLENPHPIATEPVALTIGVAGFGAFIPDTPVGRVMAPGMEPGDRKQVVKQVPLVGTDLDPERLPIHRWRRIADRWPDLDEPTADVDTMALRFLAARARRRFRGERALDLGPGQRDPRADILTQAFQDMAARHARRGACLIPKNPANVVVRSPGGSIVVHRHIGMFGYIRPGVSNLMPFQVRSRQGVAVGLREVTDGWMADLRPIGWGETSHSANFGVEVTPTEDATTGCLIVDVTDVETGEVCPVEWYWIDRRMK
ncbi:MAG: hypothetical protein QNJ98_13790 [Planctomycetota bacterium]|nr:hypothetical protein [Planctomycetota bacterium]